MNFNINKFSIFAYDIRFKVIIIIIGFHSKQADLIIKKGTIDAVVEYYKNPEGYAVNLMILSPDLIVSFSY